MLPPMEPELLLPAVVEVTLILPEEDLTGAEVEVEPPEDPGGETTGGMLSLVLSYPSEPVMTVSKSSRCSPLLVAMLESILEPKRVHLMLVIEGGLGQ